MSEPLPADEQDGLSTRTTSPDGAYVWIVDADEVKMSHWIMGGSLWRRVPPARLLAAPYGWSFENRTWVSNHELKLTGRRYPGRLPGITLTIDAAAEHGVIETDDLAAHQRRGSYLWVKPGEVPAPPPGAQPLETLRCWLDAFPGH